VSNQHLVHLLCILCYITFSCVFQRMLAQSSGSLMFNCLISSTLTGCKHLSKQVTGCKMCPGCKHYCLHSNDVPKIEHLNMILPEDGANIDIYNRCIKY
jgi:hypothetical protein